MLPQLYQTELLFRSHDQMGHQEIDSISEDLEALRVAWNEKGMREVGNSMSVMPTGQGSKEVAISFTIDRVV